MTPTFVTDARFISNTLLFSVVENARFLSCDGQLSFWHWSIQVEPMPFLLPKFSRIGVPWQNQQVTASSNFSCSLSPAIMEWPLSFCHVSPASSLLACVASVPVQTKCYVSREDSREQRFWSRENWGESKKGKGAGRGWGSEGTLASKPHDSEKRPPISSRVSSLID